ncbi:hypothetical protein LAUMK191_02112 [Mycobacterium attenuatum]|nr:hypothetical protein LAUMK191_02112 [Mycobacterium attenuatum]
MPELPRLLSVLFHKPELFAPKFPKPDVPPVPELKNPDDGLLVEFPKPGPAGMSRILIVPLSMAPTTLIGTVTRGPPIAIVPVGTYRVDGPRSTGPT